MRFKKILLGGLSAAALLAAAPAFAEENNLAVVLQVGSQAAATQEQAGGTGNTAEVVQGGYGNSATQSQTGARNQAYVSDKEKGASSGRVFVDVTVARASCVRLHQRLLEEALRRIGIPHFREWKVDRLAAVVDRAARGYIAEQIRAERVLAFLVFGIVDASDAEAVLCPAPSAALSSSAGSPSRSPGASTPVSSGPAFCHNLTRRPCGC